MAATTDQLPDLELEARRLTDHLGNLATLNQGLGAAATRVESAARVLDAAHDALRATERQVETLSAATSTALGAIDRLQPDQLRSAVESGFAHARADVEHLQQQIVVELEGMGRELGAQDAAESARHQIVVQSVADAALRILDAIDQTQRRIAADQAGVHQAFAEIRGEHAAMADALAALQQRQQALAERAVAIVASADALKTTSDTTSKSVARVEMEVNTRLPALAVELQALRVELTTQARGNRIRQWLIFVATILLIALLNGLLVRFVGVR